MATLVGAAAGNHGDSGLDEASYSEDRMAALRGIDKQFRETAAGLTLSLKTQPQPSAEPVAKFHVPEQEGSSQLARPPNCEGNWEVGKTHNYRGRQTLQTCGAPLDRL